MAVKLRGRSEHSTVHIANVLSTRSKTLDSDEQILKPSYYLMRILLNACIYYFSIECVAPNIILCNNEALKHLILA